jgi:2-polyprenyl-6-methoxyphenol hydroxylase-like FAD-dependent oxidoreductase
VYDVIVVGARVAGASTAAHLARRGHRVLLVDRGDTAADTLSTHYVHQPGVAALDRLGVLGEVMASDAPPVTGLAFDVGPFALRGTPPPAVAAPLDDQRPARACLYYTYWGGIEQETHATLYPRPGRMLITSPTNDGLTIVVSFWPLADFHRVRADIEGEFLRGLEVAPAFAERLRAGAPAERFRGTADVPFYIRCPYGDGWALVGDAGYHKDPITAEGITDALLDAERLAAAIDAGLDGREPLADALAGYARDRDARIRPIYELTYAFAGLEPPSAEQQALFAALRGAKDDTDRFFGTIAGTTPIPQFFDPANLGRIVGRAAA